MSDTSDDTSSSSSEDDGLPKLLTWESNFKKGKHKSILVIGARNTGKSYFIKHLYQKKLKKLYDTVIVFSNSILSGFYQEFIDSELIFSEYTAEVIEALEESQKEMISRCGKALNVLIIFDDCISSKNKHDEMLRQCFTRGRHNPMNLTVLFSTQIATLADPSWRMNTDLLFITKQKGQGSKSHITKFFMSGLYDDEDMIGYKNETKFLNDLLKRRTLDYHMLCVDYTIDSVEAKDIVKAYKAP